MATPFQQPIFHPEISSRFLNPHVFHSGSTMDASFILTTAILFLLITLFATIGGLAIYLGMFSKVIVSVGKAPVRKIRGYYKFKRGDYRDSGTLFEEVNKLAPELRTFGVYYDNPETTPIANRRYIVGTILEEDGKPTIEDQDRLKELEKTLLENAYKEIELPDIETAIFAEFPWKTGFSILIAVNRVYAALNNFIQEKKLEARVFLELYDRSAGTIHFFAPLEKQDMFFVLECLEANNDEDYEDLSPESGNDEAGHVSDSNSRKGSSKASSRASSKANSRAGSDREDEKDE